MKKLLTVLVFLMFGCSTVKEGRYHIVYDDFKHKEIRKMSADSIQRAYAIFDSLMVATEGNFNYYIHDNEK